MNKDISKMLKEYVELHIDQLPTIYNWKIPEAKDDFEEIKDLVDRCRQQDSLYAQNLMLRSVFNEAWHTAGTNKQESDKLKLRLARWYVGTWGGIREPIKDPIKQEKRIKTLQSYINELEDIQTLLKRAKNGIPSWSKILSFVNPHKYAIFDSRVAFSVLAIQVLNGVNMPLDVLLGSRNVKILEAIKLLKDNCRIKQKPNWKSLYMEYNSMLFNIKEDIKADSIQQIEMVLFAQAESLAEEVKKYYKY